MTFSNIKFKLENVGTVVAVPNGLINGAEAVDVDPKPVNVGVGFCANNDDPNVPNEDGTAGIRKCRSFI
jgi:hypothetical protein